MASVETEVPSEMEKDMIILSHELGRLSFGVPNTLIEYIASLEGVESPILFQELYTACLTGTVPVHRALPIFRRLIEDSNVAMVQEMLPHMGL